MELFLDQNLLTIDEELLDLKGIGLLLDEDVGDLKELDDLISPYVWIICERLDLIQLVDIQASLGFLPFGSSLLLIYGQ